MTFYAFVNSSLVSAPTIAPGCAPRAASITAARALRVWYDRSVISPSVSGFRILKAVSSARRASRTRSRRSVEKSGSKTRPRPRLACDRPPLPSFPSSVVPPWRANQKSISASRYASSAVANRITAERHSCRQSSARVRCTQPRCRGRTNRAQRSPRPAAPARRGRARWQAQSPAFPASYARSISPATTAHLCGWSWPASHSRVRVS